MPSKKYLDTTGLSYFWGKVKDYVDDKSPLYLEGSFDNNEHIVFAGATPSEIIAAFNANRQVLCKIESYGIILPLVGIYDNSTEQYPSVFCFYFGIVYGLSAIGYMYVSTDPQIMNSDPWIPAGGDTAPNYLEIPYAMWGLQDVSLGNNISNGQVLTWNSAGNYWTNASVPSDASKADVTEVLTLTNAVSYTPTANYHPATKKYVDDNIPSPSSTTPSQDGTAAVGSSTTYARADHVHPSDTNKANASDVLTKTNTTSYTPSANYHPATKKYVDDSISGITDNNTTYTLSISGNVITLTPSSGQAQSITLPVYNGGVSSS